MSTPQRGMRGLQDIRTHSGKVGPTDILSKAYLRIACLELEKERRGRERESAAHRVENIDARFREIEAEKAAILETLGVRHTPIYRAARDAAAESRHDTGAVRIRY